MGEKRSTMGMTAFMVREFDPNKDWKEVEEVERRCEVGHASKMSLFTNLLGDPICRIRHSPPYLMLVAEMEQEGERKIVGMVRGCIKTVSCGGRKLFRNGSSNGDGENDPTKIISPIYAKVASILGLRVCPSHRRIGIGLALVKKMEAWFIHNGAEYSYITTEKDNQASLNLFLLKCSYSKFRTPSMLVRPVYAHRVKIPNRVSIFELDHLEAESLYRARFSATEFFPRDIDCILNNKLNLGTFVAMPTGSWPGSGRLLADPPESWAVVSIWNCKETFTLEVKGAPRALQWIAKATRAADRLLPFLGIPSVPQLFKPFGFHFLYGLGGEGPRAGRMMEALCAHAHNLAKEMGCAVVATEVASRDPLRPAIQHWKRLSCEEDVWCMKRLVEGYSDGPVGDWTYSQPGFSIFVDPREV
ncbi:probable N-acetyltransferase HLS1 [Rhodamnia argentea]|uniref:Probable N-acetyltransferase HLS1 n=1 Tax=Rhodamnia argentea TaxID=178133 RepID=A0A8B8NL19_9MYRT|nr:probable N-acetyltransferase HLS1 [Rhodamnia argentea]